MRGPILQRVIPDAWRRGYRLGLIAGIGLLFIRVTFALIVPLGSAPDEQGHFIKAYASARLEVGDRNNIPLAVNPTDMDRLNQSLGAIYDLGSQGVNPTWGCNAFSAEVPASCVNLDAATYSHGFTPTAFGSFQPYLYAVTGLPSLLIHDPDTSLLAMRLMVVLWSTLITVAALAIISRRFGTAGLLAALVGLTPMVLYTQGTLGTTGIEAAGALGAFVALLDILWDTGRSSSRLSRALALVAIPSLLLCRPLSVLVGFVVAVIILATIGFRPALRRLGDLPRGYDIALGAVIVGATVANLGWSLSTPDFYRGQEVTVMGTLQEYTLGQLPQLWREVIGLFEWLDTELPFMALIVAWASIGLVVVGVFPNRDRQSAARLWFLVVSTVVFGFIVDYTVFARVGGDVQGRHLLPLFQLWTLVAVLPNSGEPAISPIINRSRLRWCVIVSGGVLALSVLYIARREAVGISGPLNFFGHAAWHPQAGWILPFVLLIVGLVFAFVVPAAFGVLAPPAVDVNDDVHGVGHVDAELAAR